MYSVYSILAVCLTGNTVYFLQSHYSIKKAGAVLGFGKENVILLKTDERYHDSTVLCQLYTNKKHITMFLEQLKKMHLVYFSVHKMHK